MREVKLRALDNPNELRVVWDGAFVYVEIIAKHGGDTQVASSVKVARIHFSDAIRQLGAVS